MSQRRRTASRRPAQSAISTTSRYESPLKEVDLVVRGKRKLQRINKMISSFRWTIGHCPAIRDQTYPDPDAGSAYRVKLAEIQQAGSRPDRAVEEKEDRRQGRTKWRSMKVRAYSESVLRRSTCPGRQIYCTLSFVRPTASTANRVGDFIGKDSRSVSNTKAAVPTVFDCRFG